MERAFRVLIAAAAWAGLGIQLWILLSGGAFETPALAVWRFAAFFTILTNLIVAIVSTISALAPESAFGRFVGGANARAAAVLHIGAVGVIYPLVLAGLWDPQGWQLIADQLLHTATPVLVTAGWLLFDRKDGLSFKALPLYLLYPVGYTLYALARGAGDGFYPYPFIDVSQIGYPRAFLNIAGLTGAFVIGAGVIILLGKALSGAGIRQAA
ncbi:MAG: Pr6Pr family membrane protein [Hyphomonas sp.]|nr:Pr6Pr family membrane protein [Hyphomonas sp.]